MAGEDSGTPHLDTTERTNEAEPEPTVLTEAKPTTEAESEPTKPTEAKPTKPTEAEPTEPTNEEAASTEPSINEQRHSPVETATTRKRRRRGVHV